MRDYAIRWGIAWCRLGGFVHGSHVLSRTGVPAMDDLTWKSNGPRTAVIYCKVDSSWVLVKADPLTDTFFMYLDIIPALTSPCTYRKASAIRKCYQFLYDALKSE